MAARLLAGTSMGFLVSQAFGIPTACQPDEARLFSCPVGRKVVAVCASRDWSAARGHLQYRFGSERKAELVLPRGAQTPPSQSALAASMTFSGGGGASLRFSSGSHDYIVYSAISSSWGEKSGVVIEQAGRAVRSLRCSGKVDSELGSELFSRGGFSMDDSGFTPP